MADSRFFSVTGPFSVSDLAEVAAARIGEGVDPGARFTDVQPLDVASSEHVSFLDNKLYVKQFAASRAGACLVHADYADLAPDGMALLLCDNPYRAYARVAAAFYPTAGLLDLPSSPTYIDDTASIANGCDIATGTVIGANAEIGENSRIGANTVIGPGVVIGRDCVIGSNVTIAYGLLGDRIIIHAGVQIGQGGFGFAPGEVEHLEIPQLGRVVIEDDVCIGANTSVDRGSGPDTVIGAGTKIDNLVQIAHNVKVGRNCFVASLVGISGSTKIGDFTMIGGQAGLAGHLNIGKGARIGGQSGVIGDIDAGVTVGGFPARPLKEWLRGVAVLRRIALKKGQTHE